jgi:hypothetical protein
VAVYGPDVVGGQVVWPKQRDDLGFFGGLLVVVVARA